MAIENGEILNSYLPCLGVGPAHEGNTWVSQYLNAGVHAHVHHQLFVTHDLLGRFDPIIEEDSIKKNWKSKI